MGATLMVRALRNSLFGQLFLGAIVVAIILAFLFTGTGGGGSLESECALQVGKSCISPKEYFASFNLIRNRITEKGVKQLQLQKQAALGLVEREALLKEAMVLGISSSQDAVDNEAMQGRAHASLPVAGADRLALSIGMCVPTEAGCAPGTVGIRTVPVKKNGKFNFAVYKRNIQNITGRSPNHFKEMQVKELTASRMRHLIKSQVRVSTEEAFLAYSRARSRVRARIANLSSDWFSRFSRPETEDELTAWSKDHSEELSEAVTAAKEEWPMGCAVVREIVLSTNDETETKEGKALLNKLKVTARSEARFDRAARQYSTKDSASLGGRVTCLYEGAAGSSPEALAAVSRLKKRGDISPVLESSRGLELIQLLGV
ncbi:MAG: SurA N-terminal domain-containing protein, partial [Polyangiaceae bacterium]|nr:SurA N-terminal domain-containing protein [Polyangiaceae bacterium]